MLDVFFDTMLPVNSASGGEVDSLIRLIYGITAFFFLVMEGYLVYLLIRYRRPGHGEYKPGATLRELGWILTLAFVVLALDLAIDAKSARAWERIKVDMPESGLTVKVQAQQFLWTFVYPGRDGKLDTPDDLVSPQELHVPLNTKMRLLLRSHDVIHSLFLPATRFKQDVLPGREIPAWIELNRAGETPIICAELCGSAHAAMSGKLVAEDEKAFKKFLAGLAAESN